MPLEQRLLMPASNSRADFVQPMSRMGGDAGEDIGEPGLWVDAIHFRRDDEAVHCCGAPPSAIRSAEQPGLPSKSDASQASFGGILREAHASIFHNRVKLVHRFRM